MNKLTSIRGYLKKMERKPQILKKENTICTICNQNPHTRHILKNKIGYSICEECFSDYIKNINSKSKL